MSNVVQLNLKDDKNVWGCMKTFLDRIGQNSENTKTTYETAMRGFFITMRNKKLEDLVESDLIFTKQQIATYQINLRNKYKSSTVNNKMSAMKKCYSKLQDFGFAVDEKWFDVDRYTEHDKESYDHMTHEEVIKAINYISTTRKGLEKSLMIRVAYATAFRKDSIKNLKWTDIINKDGIWFMKTLGKGNKWDYKKISNDLFEELMKLKEINSDSEYIFKLTDKTINKMINDIRDHIDFGDRKITFHSLKKASINEVALITNYDLVAMQAQGNHVNISTTLNDYMAKKRLEDLVIVDINHEVSFDKLEELSKEQLINLIKNSDRNTQIKLMQQIDNV